MLFSTLLLMLASATLGACSDNERCSDDYGCKSPRICVTGLCKYPGELPFDVVDEREDEPDLPVTREACIEVIPTVLDFGDVERHSVSTLGFSITSCGTAPLEIYDIGLSDETHDAFSLRHDPTGVRLAPGDAIEVGVQFAPTDEVSAAGRVVIVTNAAETPVVHVDLLAHGLGNVCPVAVMTYGLTPTEPAGVIRSGEQPEVRVAPLDTFYLDALASFDPDGSVAQYEWALVQVPDDSIARLRPDNTAARTELFCDLAGSYTVELRVVDDEGLISCEPARLRVDAFPVDAIHVQLVWHTPADPDETDECVQCGSDVDLHLMHQDGTAWNHEPHDCFWDNMVPSWGDRASLDDNPRLDIDDVNGAGPENINIKSPEHNHRYEVGVFYYDDHEYGLSDATVRIYLNGYLRYEHRGKTLRLHQFWWVASIIWYATDGDIEEIDGLYNGFP